MAAGNSQINPWVRANLERPDEETRAIIPPERHQEYAEVLGELEAAGSNLNEALVRFAVA